MAHNQLVNGLAETGEKFVAFDEICTELSRLSACSSAIISNSGVKRKESEPV
jgi:hypothetical protein